MDVYLRIVSAVDPNDASRGLRIGERDFVLEACIKYAPELASVALTAGDFDGDGRSEIAVVEGIGGAGVLATLSVNRSH